MLFSLPETAQRYVSAAESLYKSAPPESANDLLAQMAKVCIFY